MSIDSLPNRVYAERDNCKRNDFIKMVEENENILKVSSIDDIITITVGYDEIKKLINLMDGLINKNIISPVFLAHDRRNEIDKINDNTNFLKSIIKKYDEMVLKFDGNLG